MDHELLTKLYESGVGYAEIAEKLNCSKNMVYIHLRKLGIIGRQKKIEDLSGQHFGKITVLQHLRTGRYPKGGIYQVWECECMCGKVFTARAGNLKNGQVTCKHCAANEISNKLRKIPIDYKVWYALCWRAKKKGIEVSVTPDYLLSVYEAQDRRCALSGIEIVFGKYRHHETTASPDRIDPMKGYVEGNVRWVHKVVNSMRNQMSDDELVKWCKKIVDYQDYPNCL